MQTKYKIIAALSLIFVIAFFATRRKDFNSAVGSYIKDNPSADTINLKTVLDIDFDTACYFQYHLFEFPEDYDDALHTHIESPFSIFHSGDEHWHILLLKKSNKAIYTHVFSDYETLPINFLPSFGDDGYVIGYETTNPVFYINRASDSTTQLIPQDTLHICISLNSR